MKQVCVCGAGTMGLGIAQVSAVAGFYTIVYDMTAAQVEKAMKQLSANLQKLVDKEKISGQQKEEILQHILFTSDINHCKADLVIEAIVEDAAAKESLFRQLSAINSGQTIFASNTSSLSVSTLSASVQYPSKFAGLHFFNPAPVMKLVEVVRGQATSDETVAALVAVVKQMGKTPVVCKDAPGFIVNRVARPYYIEALRLLEEGLAEVETIDRLMETRGFKMGPFKLMDLIGNDVNYAVSCSVYEQLGRPERLRPSDIQKQKVEQGALGQKTRKGYYNY